MASARKPSCLSSNSSPDGRTELARKCDDLAGAAHVLASWTRTSRVHTDMSETKVAEAASRPRVVLDANAICADPWLTGPHGRSFLQSLSVIGAVLYVPQVVLAEAIAFYARGIQKRVQLARQLIQWMGPEGPSIALPSVEVEVQRYEQYLRRAIESVEGTILPYPTVAHDTLARKAIERIKPFGEAGSGYRDALVWASVLELLRESVSAVCLVSKDAAFGSARTLHDDLRRELVGQMADPSAVRLFPEIKDFNEDMIQPYLRNVRSAAAGEFDGQTHVWARKALVALLRDPKVTPKLLHARHSDVIDNPFSDVRVHFDEIQVDRLTNPRLRDLRLLPSGEHVGTAQLDVEFTYPYTGRLGAGMGYVSHANAGFSATVLVSVVLPRTAESGPGLEPLAAEVDDFLNLQRTRR